MPKLLGAGCCSRRQCLVHLLVYAAWHVVHLGFLLPLFRRLNVERTYRAVSLAPGDMKPRPGEVTDLEVIVASPGTSGTHSMYMALHRMGLRTYKLWELSLYTPHIVAPDIEPELLVGPIRATGVQAVVVEPWLFLVPKLLEVSPKAKVVLSLRNYTDWQTSRLRMPATTWRSSWGRWFDSLRLLCNHLPISLVWPQPEQRHHSFAEDAMSSVMRRDCAVFGARFRTDRRVWPTLDQQLPLDRPDSEKGMLFSQENYEWYGRHIRSLVPPERLLEFTPDMGWEVFADFLQRPVPARERGKPWPRTPPGRGNDEFVSLEEDPLGWCAAWAINLLCLVANLVVFCLCARRAPRAAAACAGLRRGGTDGKPKDA